MRDVMHCTITEVVMSVRMWMCMISWVRVVRWSLCVSVVVVYDQGILIVIRSRVQGYLSHSDQSAWGICARDKQASR